MVGWKVQRKFQRYLIDVSSFAPNIRRAQANGASVMEFGAHVIVVRALWLSELGTI